VPHRGDAAPLPHGLPSPDLAPAAATPLANHEQRAMS
jgi:hypothetical protein